jgi:hypothetical protein
MHAVLTTALRAPGLSLLLDPNGLATTDAIASALGAEPDGWLGVEHQLEPSRY